MKSKKSAVYYHGSPERFEVLRAGSYVTPHKEDALIFAVPWSSSELKQPGNDPDGRPPRRLEFKGRPPKDHPLYVYEVRAETESAPTNTGVEYSWNRVTTEDAKARLIKTIPSWHGSLLSGGFSSGFKKKVVT